MNIIEIAASVVIAAGLYLGTAYIVDRQKNNIEKNYNLEKYYDLKDIKNG